MNRKYSNNRMYGIGYLDGVADCADDIKEAQEYMDIAWERAYKAEAEAKEATIRADNAEAEAKEATIRADNAEAEAKEAINYCDKSQAIIDEVKIKLKEITSKQNHLRIENRLLGDKAVKAKKAEKEAHSAHTILVLNGVRGESLEAVHDVMESRAKEALGYREAIEANKTRIRMLGGQRQTLRLALADAHINGEL